MPMTTTCSGFQGWEGVNVRAWGSAHGAKDASILAQTSSFRITRTPGGYAGFCVHEQVGMPAAQTLRSDFALYHPLSVLHDALYRRPRRRRRCTASLNRPHPPTHMATGKQGSNSPSCSVSLRSYLVYPSLHHSPRGGGCARIELARLDFGQRAVAQVPLGCKMKRTVGIMGRV